MKFQWLLLAIVLVACVVIYWPGMHGPFLFDDFPNLAALTSIDHLNSWRDLGIYLSQPRGFPGRPLAMLSFLPQKASWPDHPFPFHLVNLAIHLLCGGLVYRLTALLARQYLTTRATSSIDHESRASLAALLATAAWLFNPIQISGVLLVVQRMTLLMAFFTLLGLLSYLKGLLHENASELTRGAWMLLGLGVCMMLAFLSKENGILLPLYVLVLDVTLLRRNVARLPLRLQWWRRLLIWPVILFIFGYLLIDIPQLAQGRSIRDFTLGQRLLTEPRILFNYLGDIFLPRFGLYGLYHDGFPISHGFLHPWTTPVAIIGLLVAALAGLLGCRRWPLLSLAILWYLGGQTIESSTVMLELYFEHRNYVPIIGPFVALAIGLAGLHPPKLRARLLGMATLWLFAATFTTLLSTRVYRSEDSLAVAWAAKQPDSIRAQSMLAERLYRHGQLSLALRTIDAIIVKYPDNTGLIENKIYLKCMEGALTAAEMQRATEVLRVAPFEAGGFRNVKNLRVLADAHRCEALNDTSWKNMVQALLDNPAYDNYGVASGYLHYQLHDLAVAHGDLDQAIRQLDATYLKDPNPEVPRLQAKYLASAGLYSRAIKTLQVTDYQRLPLLRRLLVNDRDINDSAIKLIRKQESAADSARRRRKAGG
jgi:tetratricopeptide (TPR) repeat protein